MKLSKSNSRKLILSASCALLGLAAPVQAQSSDQTFTFESTSNPPKTVGGAPNSPYIGSYWTGTSVGTLTNGQKTNSTFACVAMTQPPKDQIFAMHMMCDVTASDGTYSAVMGCQMIDAKTNEISCVGGLNGKTGAYAGRIGSITNHSVGEGKANGTGQWFR